MMQRFYWTALCGAGAMMLAVPAFAFRGEAGDQAVQSEIAHVKKNAVSAAVQMPTLKQATAAAAAEAAGVSVEWGLRHKNRPLSVCGPDLGTRQAFSGGKGVALKGNGAYGDDAIAVLDNLAGIYDITDASREFSVLRTDQATDASTHVRLIQQYQGLRVVGSELIVHFNAAGVAYEVNGQYTPGIAIDITPSIQAAEAVRLALADLAAMGKGTGELAVKPELVVYARRMDPCLAYELTLSISGTSARWRYWIDALDGHVVFRYNDLKRIAAPTVNGENATLSGTILAGEGGTEETVSGWKENSNLYYLCSPLAGWLVYNVGEGSAYPDATTFAYRTTDDWGDSDPAEMSAARNFQTIQAYYKKIHNRKSFDDKSALAIVNVHQGDNYVNAFWSPSDQAFFVGDGDGFESDSLAVLDVLGHEFTHAVTEHSCNLTYAYESGALNESFSDIFGACIEFYAQPDGRTNYPSASPGTADWLMGEDCWLETTALRDMRNPANAETVGINGRQPTRYQGSFWAAGADDNGGVHQNAGVQSFFFYLLCEGGSGDNDGISYYVDGIGITNAEKIAYKALTKYFTADTDYEGARTAWISAAKDINTNWVRNVKQGWIAVMGGTKPTFVMPSILPDGIVGSPYSCTLGVTGGMPPYTHEWLSGELLPALSCDDTGVITGMPEVAGTSSFRMVAKDDAWQAVTNDFVLTIQPMHTAPYTENFDTATNSTLPLGWVQDVVTVSNVMSWVMGTGGYDGESPSAAHSGSINARFASVATTNAAVTRLITPCIDLGADSKATRLSFWQCMMPWANYQDALRVYYKHEWTNEWQLLATYTSAVSTWTQRKLDLDPADHARTVYFAFEGTAQCGHGVCIDDVSVWDPTPPLGITTASPLPDAVTEQPYSATLAAEGGASNYTYAVVSGSLPDGFYFFPDGVITGLCTTVQTAAFTVQVTDGEGATATKDFTLSVEKPRADLYDEDFEYNAQMPTGWTQEYVTDTVLWTVKSGGWDSDHIGHPEAAESGHYNMYFYSSALDNNSAAYDQKTKLVSPQIDLGQAPAYIKLTFWLCMEGVVEYNFQDELRVFYRTSTNDTWKLLSEYTTNISDWTKETLLLPNPTSTYQLAFEGNARSGYGVCIDNLTISDGTDAPIITTGMLLPNGLKGQPYTFDLAAVGGSEPYSWTVVSNALPTGLNLDADTGMISGTGMVATLKSFSVRVAGLDGRATTNLFTLRIVPPGTMPYTETFENGGTMPDGWTQSSDSTLLNWTFRSGSPVASEGYTPAAAHGGTYNACLFYEKYKTPTLCKLISPMLNLGSNSTNTMLSFWLCMSQYGSWYDRLNVLYKNTPTNDWTLLSSFTTPVSAWTNVVLDLPNPSKTYYIAFEGWAQYGAGVCIDDVEVTGDLVLSAYEIWQTDQFGTDVENDAIAGDRADPDGDGIVNALEYAMGLDPNAVDTEGLPGGGATGGYLTLSFRMSKEAVDAGVLYEVESCTNLVDQVWSTTDITQTGYDDSNTWWQATFRHDVPVTNAPQRFMRFKVTLPAH